MAAVFPIALYFVTAAVGGMIPRGIATSSTETRDIVLINGPIHYDILIPIDIARRDMGWLAAQGIALDHPEVEWLLIGWGARAFYTTTGTYSDVSPGAVWRGLTGDTAVMRVSVAGPLRQDWPRVALDRDQMHALIVALTDSFANGAGTQALDQPGFSYFDRFFPAKGQFNLFNTCNVWVGDTLRRAGIRFGLWTPTPYAVTLSHWLFQKG